MEKKLFRLLLFFVAIIVIPLTQLNARFTNEIPHQLETCSILLQVDYSETGTDWEIIRIKERYPNSFQDNGYLIFDKVVSNGDIAFEITVRIAIGENKQIFVGVLDTTPRAFWAIAGAFTHHPWEVSTGTELTDSERQTIWDNGYKFAVEPSLKLCYLFYIQYIEYVNWVKNSLIDSPLSNVDAYLSPDARLKNNTEFPIVSVFASIRAKWRGFFFPFQAGIVDAWWPKGSANDAGNASWGFDLTVVNRVGDWLSDTFVYGDNGTIQTIYWDNIVKATHQHYGFKHLIETLNTPPPTSVKLEHENVWSGNHNYLTMTFLADDVIFSNVWESPTVGDTPVPQKIHFMPGWNYEEGFQFNSPPVAVCKDADILISENCQASITPADIDAGSYDPDDGDTVLLELDSAGPFPPGVHYVSLTVTDNMGESDTCSASITVKDSQPPVPMISELPTIFGECSATVSQPPKALDNCDGEIIGITTQPLIYTEQGTHIITWIYTDSQGNSSLQDQVIVISDESPPVFSDAMAVPSTLWPPNKKIIPVAINAVVEDNCDSDPEIKIISVTSNEPLSKNNDWEITGDLTLNLRADRLGKGSGRIYSIVVAGTDVNGNISTKTVYVTVPHNQ